MTITGLIDPESCPFYYTYSERQCFLNCTGSTRARWNWGQTNCRQILQGTVVSKKTRSPIFDTLGGQVPWYLSYCSVAVIKYLYKYTYVFVFSEGLSTLWWGRPDGGKGVLTGQGRHGGRSKPVWSQCLCIREAESEGKWSLARKPQGLPQ